MKQRGRKSAAKLAVIGANVPASDHDRHRSSNNLAPSSRDLPPSHLSAATKQWWAVIVAEHQLGEHELQVLTIACEAFDRREQAREALNKHGLSYTDDKGMVRARPEVAIERDSAIRFLRAMRELNLNAEPLDHNRNVHGISSRQLQDDR